MIKVENLSFSYGETPLYEGVSFIVSNGQKTGLVGPNGSGKSTLLNILTGKEEGHVGKVMVQGTVASVPQEIKYDPVMESSETVKVYVDPNNNYEEFELLKLFAGLELETKLLDKPQTLSGGQKTKLSLARALLSNPDILLLDEPTNFMDTAGKHFVMNFLSEYQGTVIVISHDLDLMDNAIDKVLAVNPAQRKIEEYKGNYSSYIRLKKEKEELLKRQVLIKKKHIEQMVSGLSRMKKMSAKQKTKQRRRIEKEKRELPELPPEVRAIKIKLPEPARVGEIPIRSIGISKSYDGEKVLGDINFSIKRGERIALLGPNGSGKSTFIKILMGIIKPDGGEVIKNESAKIGYYSQEFETFDFQKSVLESFCDGTKKDEWFARSFLGRYMFLQDKVFQNVGSLSGGEKTRLSIAILTGSDNNLLVLDEPTTYLDVISQRVILDALKDYTGTMIVVSHTPDFVKELEPVKAYLFPEEKMIYWEDGLLDKVLEV
ncbi:MAG TPA: ABC-F family ATP-binding cassette domain-containing protein [Patescibacteria group bacterium]|nr:ABC-F family ATP-binding cassette domain-containing protein [Patescibacteria group bacterium]